MNDDNSNRHGIINLGSRPEIEADGANSANNADYDAELGARSKKPLIIVTIIVLLLIIGGGAGYYLYQQSQISAEPVTTDASQAQTVTVIIPKLQSVTSSINATGSLAARNDIPIGVTGEGGLVSRVYVDAGDWVKAGQTLISIERSVQIQQLEAQRAQISIAEADLKLAQSELDRAQQLIDRGFISKADVDRRVATRDSARARVRAAQAQANELSARTARLDIRAPSSGYILERNVEKGQTVSQGNSTLFRMAQNGQLELRALLSEVELASIKVGEPATITPVGLEQQFKGNIWAISPTINPQTRQGMARIAVPFDSALRPGGFASVSIQSGTQNAPILPTSAVQNDGTSSFVFIVGADNKVEKRSIEVGSVNSDGLIIKSGLTGNERVVLRAGGFLSEGVTVNPVTE